ncbi:MAG: hypothetical protein JWM47_3620, partial [Acidimicrobiales bacterium]|nr:hypothetical protein [Acidimicrobiales bacterium]
LEGPARAAADSGLSGALKVAGEIGGARGAALAEAAKSAFVDGIVGAAVVSAIVVLFAAVASWFLLPRGSQLTTAAGPAAPVDEEGAAGDLVDEHVRTSAPVID